MVTKLVSLKIDADASGYARGAAQKVAADQSMIASSDAVGRAFAQADARLEKAIPGVARLSTRFLEGYQSAARFEAAVRQVGAAVDRGMGLDRARTLLDAIYQSFGATADAAQLVRSGFSSIVPVIDSLNSKMAAQEAIAARAAAATAMAVRQSGAQSTINTRLGVRDDFNTEARAADVAAYGQELDRLTARFAPLRHATDMHAAEMAELATAYRVGAVTAEEFAAAQLMLQQRLAQRQAAIGTGGRPAAPTGSGKLDPHAMANLSYQFNDIAVMTASGQAPFMMLMQQGMQVGQLMNSQMLGLGAATKAVGAGLITFLLNPLNLAVIGFAGATAAAVHFFGSMKSDAPKVEDLLQAQRDLIRDMAKAWGDAAVAADRYDSSSGDALRLRGRIASADLRATLRSETVAALQSGPSPYAQGPIGRSGAPTGLSQIDQAIVRLRESMRTGMPDILAFRAELEKIADDPGASLELLRQASAWLEVTKNAAAAQSALSQVDEALKYVAPDRKMTEALGNRSYGIARDRELSQRAIVHQIDMDAITAKSPSQRADIAARREEASLLNEVIDGTVALQRVENARQLAYAEAQNEINLANRERIVAGQDAISAAELEVTLIGKTASETAHLRANYQAYVDLKRAAEANGLAFDTEFYELLKRQNAELAHQAELLAERKFDDDLQFELDQLFRSPRDAEIESRLRSSGIDLTGPQADALRQQMELNQAIKDFRDISSEAWQGFISDLRAGVSLMDASLNALNRISDRMFEMASDQLFNQIFALAQQFLQSGGMSGGGGVDLESLLSSMPTAATGTNALPGSVYRINESGEEYFAPHVPGRILPPGSFDGVDGLAKTGASPGGGKPQVKVEMPVMIYNTIGDADVRAERNPTTREMEIFIDQRQARNAADPYSRYSGIMGARGVRPGLRQR